MEVSSYCVMEGNFLHIEGGNWILLVLVKYLEKYKIDDVKSIK